MAKRGTKRVLEYARLAMGFANVRASRYGIRSCSGGYSSTNANAGAGAGNVVDTIAEDIMSKLPQPFDIEQARHRPLSVECRAGVLFW